MSQFWPTVVTDFQIALSEESKSLWITILDGMGQTSEVKLFQSKSVKRVNLLESFTLR
jgi:hypothetical protein